MTAPLTDYHLRHYRALIERERTHAGETAAGILLAATLARLQHVERRLAEAEDAGILLAATLARLQHLERRLAQAEDMAAVLQDMQDISEADCPYRDNCPVFGSNHGTCIGCKARRALAAWAPVEGQEP